MAPTIKILLADDDKEDQLILSDAFEQIGITNVVHFVDNGEHALVQLEKCFEDDVLPRLIILDLNMPRMNGTQTLRLVKQDDRFKHIPIIIYSTSLNNIEKDECIRLGAHSYIIKPLTFSEYVKSAEFFYNLCLE
ncbi:Response regulator receiver domain-containing protein [Filimonas lacunae]|uniref:Response regulator receiver domain-containing protein n=1 Tax=Filimonas lacunae TaxID=477680 RepID=A0A173MLQ2_9BACT|nr:response regulator [Filimonas lacunae]BAV08554.1 two-component response regulator [Filimonas lacunae]SIS56994.1 Response regulator receiver domain-containing protein [Filimonas lacunae]